MKNPNSAFRLSVFALMILFAQMLPAQWVQTPSLGNEDIFSVLNIAGVWVAEGETGCYRSTNDGLLWTKTLTFNTSSASSICQSGSDVYAISYKQGIYRSSDQGQSWNLLSNQFPANFNFPERLDITGNFILYQTQSAVYRYDKTNPSTPTPVLDFGQLYYPDAFLLMHTIGDEIWVSVKDSLLRSTDEGTSWALVHEGFKAKSLSVHDDTIMICTETGLQRSVDNGNTWSEIFSGNNAWNSVFWQSGLWFIHTYLNNHRSFQFSSNGGNSWQPYSVFLDDAGINTFALANNGGTTVLGTSIGSLHTTDGGNYWEVRNTGISNLFPGSNGGQLYRFDDYLGFGGYASDDDGETWFGPLIDPHGYRIPYVAHHGNYFVIGNNQKLYRSDGDLRHWQDSGIQFTTGVSHRLVSDGTNFYLFEYDTWNGSPATVYKSIDDGLSWSSTSGIVNSALDVIVYNSALFEWRGNQGLFRSQNDGVTWQSVGAGLNELTQGSSEATVYSDGTHLFVYGYYAIMVSTNNGLTFTKISNNLLSDFGSSIGAEYLASDGNIIVALTYNGIHFSHVLSDQWFNISENLPNIDFYNSNLVVQNGYIFLDYGHGVDLHWKYSLDSINLAHFNGIVYRDDNNNGQQDPGELPYPGATLQAGTGSFSTSGTDGHYALFADLNNDTLRIKKPVPWAISNPEFYNVNASASGKDFGLYFPPNITDLHIDLTNQTVFRPGFEENIYLSYTNFGTTDASGNIRFVANSPLEFQSAFPAPDVVSSDTLFWNNQTFNASSSGQIIVIVKVPVGTPIGSQILANASIYPTQIDANYIDNQSFLSEPVFGSYDPNDKRCDAIGISPPQIAAGKALTYTIRFQNTGTYAAEFVNITDTLDFHRLDVATFQVLASSHPCQTTLRDNGIVEFLFDPIDLPPSDFNESASHGFVKYSIQPKPGLALGQEIRNTAHIYFDFNTDIVTNTTVTSVTETVGTHDFGQNDQIQTLIISPNPCPDIVQILTGEKNSGTLRIFNATGMLVFEKKEVYNAEKLDLSFLSSGHYLLYWQSKTGWRKLGKLMKAK